MNNGIPPSADRVDFTTAHPSYDFRNPTRALVEHNRNLDPLYADFATNLAASLSMQLQAKITITAISIDLMRYDEFTASLGNPTCFSILRIDPPNAQACLDIPLNVIFPLLNALSGREETACLVPDRALTQSELSSTLKIIERAAGHLADSFSRYVPPAVSMAVKAEELCNDPAQVRLMPAGEVLTVMRFEVNFSGHHATMRLGLPMPVVDVLCNIASPVIMASASPDRERDTQNLTQNIMQSAVELRALLAEVNLRLSDVLDMHEGDVITTDISADSPIPLRLGDQTVRFGRLGQLHGNRAFQISNRHPTDLGQGDASSAGGERTS